MNGAGSARFVTVAEAAAILTTAGDKIDPSNVSRYLARFPAIPSEKRGKYRFVDIAALIEHRKTNVFVADKQAARGTETVTTAPLPTKSEPEPFESSATENDDSLAGINKQLKLLELRRRQREEDEADGKSVPADDVLMLISTVMRSMISELERQEVVIAQRFGREVSAEFRKCRKAAQAAASADLADLAKKMMPQRIVEQATNAANQPEEEPA